MKSCFLIGNADTPQYVFSSLCEQIESLIANENVESFLVGHYGNFDRIAVSALRTVKKRYPQIILQLLLPYHPAERMVEAPEDFDGTYYPEGMETVPKPFCIVRANRKAVETSDYMICYVQNKAGNAYGILQYAIQKGKRVFELQKNV